MPVAQPIFQVPRNEAGFLSMHDSFLSNEATIDSFLQHELLRKGRFASSFFFNVAASDENRQKEMGLFFFFFYAGMVCQDHFRSPTLLNKKFSGSEVKSAAFCSRVTCATEHGASLR